MSAKHRSNKNPVVGLLRCECGRVMKVRRNALGREGKCRGCGRVIIADPDNLAPVSEKRASTSAPGSATPRPDTGSSDEEWKTVDSQVMPSAALGGGPVDSGPDSDEKAGSADDAADGVDPPLDSPEVPVSTAPVYPLPLLHDDAGAAEDAGTEDHMTAPPEVIRDAPPEPADDSAARSDAAWSGADALSEDWVEDVSTTVPDPDTDAKYDSLEDPFDSGRVSPPDGSAPDAADPSASPTEILSTGKPPDAWGKWSGEEWQDSASDSGRFDVPLSESGKTDAGAMEDDLTGSGVDTQPSALLGETSPETPTDSGWDAVAPPPDSSSAPSAPAPPPSPPRDVDDSGWDSMAPAPEAGARPPAVEAAQATDWDSLSPGGTLGRSKDRATPPPATPITPGDSGVADPFAESLAGWTSEDEDQSRNRPSNVKAPPATGSGTIQPRKMPAPPAGAESVRPIIPRLNLGVHRYPWIIFPLTCVTLGGYYLYWVYRVQRELRDHIGRRHGMQPWIVTALHAVPGVNVIWLFYALYRICADINLIHAIEGLAPAVAPPALVGFAVSGTLLSLAGVFMVSQSVIGWVVLVAGLGPWWWALAQVQRALNEHWQTHAA